VADKADKQGEWMWKKSIVSFHFFRNI
jgi:hypothetical protein